MLRLVCLSLTLCVVKVGFSAEPGLRLYVDPTGFDAAEQDVRRLLLSAGRELHRHFPDFDPGPILITRGRSGPITLYERNADRQIVVRLDTHETYWSQYSYQWGHELCHILCGYRAEGRGNKWFEETLCEVASLYVLRRMSETWEQDPPYPNWKEYRRSLRKYADDVIAGRDPLTLADLPEFYRRHASALRKNPTDRDLNGAMAVPLLALFEAHPEHWEAIRWLNTAPATETVSFEDYLRHWKQSAPEKHRDWITRLSRQFGVDLGT